MIAFDMLSDGLFAAVAAIGFGAISDPPMRAFPVIALLAAVGHALRFALMQWGVDIASASLCASVTIGVGSLLLGGRIRCPMTVLFIPALLPMIPGMYAYKTIFSMIMFMQHLDDPVLGSEYAGHRPQRVRDLQRDLHARGGGRGADFPVQQARIR